MNGLRDVGVAGDYKIDDPALVTWRNEFRTETGVAELQIALFDFRQKSFRDLGEGGDGQAVLLVVIFGFHVGGRRAKQKGYPQSFLKVHVQVQVVSMRKLV